MNDNPLVLLFWFGLSLLLAKFGPIVLGVLR